jgi:predicted protein tyrosine phosphatase
MNVLFGCSRNKWRSPTAEKIYKNHFGIKVKSAGTEPSARIKLTANIINWADIIFAMEKKHKQKMMKIFPTETNRKEIIVLDIPDEYEFMDSELIEEIQAGVKPYLV